MAEEGRRVAKAGASLQRSFSLSKRTLKLLDDRARELSESQNSLAERLLDEGLHTEPHPLIVFRTVGIRLSRHTPEAAHRAPNLTRSALPAIDQL
jgi:hypothetical protein